MEFSTSFSKTFESHQNSYINNLLVLLPADVINISSPQMNNYEKIINGLYRIAQESRGSECKELLSELGVNHQTVAKLDQQQRFNEMVKAIEKGMSNDIKKANVQINNYFVNSKKNQKNNFMITGKQNEERKDLFHWLKLENKYPMYDAKLKAKLVQAICDSKNEGRLHQRVKNSTSKKKVELMDQSLILDEYENKKIDYQWSQEDQYIFTDSIKNLKLKFNKTEFLKRCCRFKFISQHQLDTLASEEISRKLDKNSKIFLSREFLLDKYYSTTQNLTEQQMRFILKTSPMLSKCVDKNFIRSSIKVIRPEDISKLELKIAQDIINRFDQIRKAARESRKIFKQNKNDKIKIKILEFERDQEWRICRQIARQEMKRHKIHFQEPFNPKTIKRGIPSSKTRSEKLFMPLNSYHPASSLFSKDCNQQCSDDQHNVYEIDYLHRLSKQPRKNVQITMKQFYTGGPQENIPPVNSQFTQIICQTLKSLYFEKCLTEGLSTIDIESMQTMRTSKSRKTCAIKSTKDIFIQTKGQISKQVSKYENQHKMTMTKKNLQTPDEILKRIKQNKAKTKTSVYINKLLSLSAENGFQALKNLNAKFTSQQVNTKDKKGNTALLYASKFKNIDFIFYLLSFGANPNIQCEKGWYPIHYIFKINKVDFLVNILCIHNKTRAPNLNLVNSEGKTPLAYASHQTLRQLNLEDGVVSVDRNNRQDFDNNNLMQKMKESSHRDSMAMFESKMGTQKRL